jgi:ribosome-associated protein
MTTSGSDPVQKAKWIVEAALDRLAERPVVLDMRQLTAYADTFIILSGRSDRQVRAIAEEIVQTLKSRNDPPLGVEGMDEGNWVLIDCNDAIVHIFDPETREQFDLERLWRDAPRLDLGLEGLEPSDSDSLEPASPGDAADPAA